MSTTTTPRQIEERAQALLDHDVLCCASALVDGLLLLETDILTHDTTKAIASAFSWEEVENLYSDPSAWPLDRCREYIEDNGGTVPDSEDVDEWRDAVTECSIPAEVLEWWRVTKQLADELLHIGEPVLRNEYGAWWGRTCSRQAIMADGTLQDVARLIFSR